MAKLILIADDNENDAWAVGRTLRTAGVKNPLTTVSDGVEVIAWFKGQGKYWDRKKFPIPGVLLLDLKMPRISGFAVMEWLNDQQEVRNHTLVVVLTGLENIENMQRAYSLGARSFLTKPCQVENVRKLVRGYSAYWKNEMLKGSVASTSNGHAGGGPRASVSP